MFNKHSTTIRRFVIRSMDNLRRKRADSIYRYFERKGEWYIVKITRIKKAEEYKDNEEEQH